MLSVSAKKTYEPVPAGTHLAVCVGLYDIGTQRNEQYGKENKQDVLVWELPEVRKDFEIDGVMKNMPQQISKFYNRSLHEKATLRKHLDAWRGRSFSHAELALFNLETIAGTSCFLSVVHKEKADGNVTDKVDSVAALPAGTAPAKPEGAVTIFTMEEGDADIPAECPPWIAKIIAASREFQEGNQSTDSPAPAAANTEEVEFDVIPF